MGATARRERRFVVESVFRHGDWAGAVKGKSGTTTWNEGDTAQTRHLGTFCDWAHLIASGNRRSICSSVRMVLAILPPTKVPYIHSLAITTARLEPTNTVKSSA